MSKQIPKAIIAPHGILQQAGPTLGAAFATLRQRSSIKRVVLLAPSHHHGFHGVAIPQQRQWTTPLGTLPIDSHLLHVLQHFQGVHQSDRFFARESSLDVPISFLQATLGDFTCFPVLCGSASAETLLRVLQLTWGSQETLVVVSADLCHFEEETTARQRDEATAEAIVALRGEAIDFANTCACMLLRAFLLFAKRIGLSAEKLALSSVPAAGMPEQFMGYGAFHFTPPATPL